LILVDTSVWIDHLRAGHPRLVTLLEHSLVLGHPWVTSELALGHLNRRNEVLGLLAHLPQATVATPAEVLALVERHELHGAGLGYVDAQLLAATLLTEDGTLWTTNKRLAAVATRLGRASQPT
jgi:predicted nucleic acid-binding protein